MVEIGWTEIIVSLIGLISADAGVVFWVVKYFLDRQAKAEANKTNSDAKRVDIEAEKEAIGNASDALDFAVHIQDMIKQQVTEAVQPVQQQLREQTKAYNQLSVRFQTVIDELEQWGCYRGQKKSTGPDCSNRMPKAMADRLPDDNEPNSDGGQFYKPTEQ